MAGEACALMTAWRARLYPRKIRLKRRKGPPVPVTVARFREHGRSPAALQVSTYLEGTMKEIFSSPRNVASAEMGFCQGSLLSAARFTYWIAPQFESLSHFWNECERSDCLLFVLGAFVRRSEAGTEYEGQLRSFTEWCTLHLLGRADNLPHREGAPYSLGPGHVRPERLRLRMREKGERLRSALENGDAVISDLGECPTIVHQPESAATAWDLAWFANDWVMEYAQPWVPSPSVRSRLWLEQSRVNAGQLRQRVSLPVSS